jgi:hypothetical protein
MAVKSCRHIMTSWLAPVALLNLTPYQKENWHSNVNFSSTSMSNVRLSATVMAWFDHHVFLTTRDNMCAVYTLWYPTSCYPLDLQESVKCTHNTQNRLKMSGTEHLYIIYPTVQYLLVLMVTLGPRYKASVSTIFVSPTLQFVILLEAPH